MNLYSEKQKIMTKKIIIIDIQPLYQRSIYFSLPEFVEHISKYDDILYYYVGESLEGDTEQEIIWWLIENGINENIINKIHFIDKSYAFFRCWMDTGVDHDDIIETVRYMINSDINDSRDIDIELNDCFDFINNTADCINLPDICLNQVKQFNNAEVIGGGRYECLAEMEILFEALNINYNLNDFFIY